MKRQNKFIFRLTVLVIFTSLILASACKKEDTEVFIRVKNTSDYKYDQVVVNTSGGTFGYGTVKSGTISSYQSFVFAYSYALIQLEINGDKFTLIPVDYEGEEKLEKGYYTYVIEIEDYSSGSLSLEVIKD